MALINGSAGLGLPGASGASGLAGAGAGAAPSQGTAGNGGFRDVFLQVFTEANQQQLAADRLNEQLVTGQVQDVAQVVLAAQKAELSLQLAIQVRNKLLEAYQEIMRMQV